MTQHYERKAGIFSFQLDTKNGSINQGDIAYYKVLEDKGDWQTIEVSYRNTHHSWSLYRAYENRIEPISYRVGNMGTALPGMILGVIVCVLLSKIIKSVQRKIG